LLEYHVLPVQGSPEFAETISKLSKQIQNRIRNYQQTTPLATGDKESLMVTKNNMRMVLTILIICKTLKKGDCTIC
jgi:hypothetical protein